MQKLTKFNEPFLKKDINKYFNLLIKTKSFGNYGRFSKLGEDKLKKIYKNSFPILTHSCTAALEICAILLNIKKGDEIIMPSFTFSSTANAFALRGAKIIFADIKISDCNIDENKIERLISKRTVAVVVVHYAGRCPNMQIIKNITLKHNIYLIEDAAQAFLTKYKGKIAGSFGDFATVSFHESKNISSGQGGVLLINKKKFIKRAKVIRDKGTNKDDFYKKKIQKYNWVDIGSSYTMGETSAMFLNYQLDKKFILFKKRIKLWKEYRDQLKILATKNICYLPPLKLSGHNAHIFFIIFKNLQLKKKLEKTINIKFPLYSHYEPLHSSSAGKIYGITKDKLKITDYVSQRILRLPLYNHMPKRNVLTICNLIRKYLNV